MISYRILTINGEHLQVLQEFSDNWFVALKFNKFFVYNVHMGLFTKSKFIQYKIDTENVNWRNQKLKSKKVDLYNQILDSLIALERNYKINKVLEKNDYNYSLCC